METRINYTPANQCEGTLNIGNFECNFGAFSTHVYMQMMKHIGRRDEPVSYTHLTLPTIYSV